MPARCRSTRLLYYAASAAIPWSVLSAMLRCCDAAMLDRRGPGYIRLVFTGPRRYPGYVGWVFTGPRRYPRCLSGEIWPRLTYNNRPPPRYGQMADLPIEGQKGLKTW